MLARGSADGVEVDSIDDPPEDERLMARELEGGGEIILSSGDVADSEIELLDRIERRLRSDGCVSTGC